MEVTSDCINRPESVVGVSANAEPGGSGSSSSGASPSTTGGRARLVESGPADTTFEVILPLG